MTSPTRKKIVRTTGVQATPVTAAGKTNSAANLDNLSRLIPDKEILSRYVNRKIHGVPDFDYFAAARKNKWNTLIEGPTGAGKTMGIQAWAASVGLPFYSVSANAGRTLESMVGYHRQNEEGRWVFGYGPVSVLAKHGGVLLFNEVNFLPERITSGLFSLLDGRRQLELSDNDGEVITAHDDLVIIADMNPHYAGTREMNAAFRNRFPQKIVWEYDPAVEQRLVKSNTLLTIAHELRRKPDEVETPTSTNMMMVFEQMYAEFGGQVAMENFVAAYGDDEREVVRNLVKLRLPKIEADLRPPVEVKKDDFIDAEEFAWEFVDTNNTVSY